MTDRTYWHVPGARSWHADKPRQFFAANVLRSLCGRFGVTTETADRLPPTAHFCGNCSRSVAARTDVEADVPVAPV